MNPGNMQHPLVSRRCAIVAESGLTPGVIAGMRAAKLAWIESTWACWAAVSVMPWSITCMRRPAMPVGA